MMLLLKKIDVYGQVVALFGCFLYAFFKQNLFLLVLIYFVIGGWQVISMLLNKIFAKNKPLLAKRKKYEMIVLGIALMCLLGYLGIITVKTDFIALPVLICLLFGSPFLAIWYFDFNYKELEIWEAEALVHLNN